MRSIWSGAVSFGLINIPVRLFSGSEEHPINFDMLHKTDLSPIRFARICLEDGKEIPYKDIVKGYEYQKGEYIVIDAEDFKLISKSKTDTIEIVQFAKEEEIDSVFYEKPYFLEPGKGGNKAYALLLQTLKNTKKVAIVKFVFRNKEHLGVLRPYQGAIILNQMRFASEVRDTKELKLPENETISKKDIEISTKLVEQLTSKFNPADFHDDYTQELQEIIDAKVKGVKPAKKGVERKTSKIHDITALLQASLEEASRPKKKKAEIKKTSASKKRVAG